MRKPPYIPPPTVGTRNVPGYFAVPRLQSNYLSQQQLVQTARRYPECTVCIRDDAAQAKSAVVGNKQLFCSQDLMKNVRRKERAPTARLDIEAIAIGKCGVSQPHL